MAHGTGAGGPWVLTLWAVGIENTPTNSVAGRPKGG